MTLTAIIFLLLYLVVALSAFTVLMLPKYRELLFEEISVEIEVAGGWTYFWAKTFMVCFVLFCCLIWPVLIVGVPLTMAFEPRC